MLEQKPSTFTPPQLFSTEAQSSPSDVPTTKKPTMAFWGLEIKPGKNPTPLNLERRLVIKQAALSVAKSSPEPVVLSVRPSCRREPPLPVPLSCAQRAEPACSHP